MPLSRKEKAAINRRNLRDKRVSEARTFLGGVCVVCGTMEGLDFDHIDRTTKLFNISKAAHVSLERFWTEVRKCQLLCRPHHVEKSNREGVWTENPFGGVKVDNRGEAHGKSKLMKSDVLRIRELAALGHSQASIAEEFAIGHQHVWKIVNRKAWKHV